MIQSGEDHAAAIEAWMISNIQKGGYEHYDDLHLDRISSSWGNPELWISAGIEALRLCVQIRDKHAPNFSIALAFPLKPAAEAREPDFQSVSDLKQALDETPPSIYLFRRGSEPWVQPRRPNSKFANDILIRDLTVNPLLEMAPDVSFHYIEFRQAEFAEYSRSLILAA